MDVRIGADVCPKSGILIARVGPIVVNEFIDRVEKVLAQIKANPKLYQLYRPDENVHRCVIHERIVLYYRLVDDETIDLLTFWNTSRDPNQLKL